MRAVCTHCGTIHYENPKTVVGCVVEHEGRILLCRRAIEPARGLWTVPAGYTELGESQVQGAIRETREEADAEIDIAAPHAYLDIPHISQTYAIFRARLLGGKFGCGVESLESRLFALDDLPWDELAFPVVSFVLKLFVEDVKSGSPSVHLGIVRWNGQGSRYDAGQYDLEDHMAVPLGRGAR
jgi:ADP-ribose/FAD diphosphatase